MTPPQPDRNDRHEHPRGALLFILVYLGVVVVFWINTYLRLWLRD